MVKGLKKENLIDGIGMQSHLQMSSPTKESYAEALKMYGDLGLEVQVTELDVNTKSNTRSAQLDLAQRYRDIMNTILQAKKDGVNVTAVVIWGITDATSWIGGYPVLFDEDYHAKPSFYAVQDPAKEIQTVKNKDAYIVVNKPGDPDSANTASKQALYDIQAPAAIGSAGSFKIVYDGKGNLAVSVTAKKDGKLTAILDGKKSDAKDVKAGDSTELLLPVTVTKTGERFGFDIAIGDEAWNSMDGTLSEENAGMITVADAPATGIASAGTVKIDGEVDDAWNNAYRLDVDTFTMGKEGKNAKGTAKVLWDNKNLYVLIQVTDPNGTHASGANHWECDTVEVFFDENNEKTGFYQADDIQCRIGYDNSKTVSDNRSVSDFTSAAKVSGSGYVIELAIPATLGALKSGQTVGFDIQINDDDGTGERAGTAIWSGDKTGMGYTDTHCFGVLTLTGNAPALAGDVNLDGEVDVSDAVLLARFVAEDSTASINAQGKINADVDGKTGLSSGDVTMILKAIAKLVTL